jgi:DNA (cytosine-5)-methyltransferase 1
VEMLNGLDLFSGLGGISYALKEWVQPFAYCEKEKYCQGILLSRMQDRQLYEAPIWDDITTLKSEYLPKNIDIIYGGFPCQDISIAGLGKGLGGERSGLFFEIVRLAKEIKPKFIFLENVPAICIRGGWEVVSSLAEMGYDCRWCVISANEFVDQKRERWFCLAKLNGMRQQKRASQRVQSIRKTSVNEKLGNYKLSCMESWAAFSESMRKNNGVSQRLHRLKSLGNAVVPQQTKKAFMILMGIQNC